MTLSEPSSQPTFLSPAYDRASLLDHANSHRDWITAIRRELHRTPELLYDLPATSAVIQRELASIGIAFKMLAGVGVVGTIGSGTEPCVALRADMDGLPIREETGAEFSSQIDGQMHACGHDAHMAMLLGAARLLKDREPELNRPVKLIFQPAEEGGAGARRLCDEGVLDDPKVDRIFGLHVFPHLPTGHIASRAGTLLAAVSMVKLVVKGQGGHAGMPHTTIDPIVTASKIICELQTIVSRESDPSTPNVVSIASVHGGDAINVIPDEVVITGTLRSVTAKGLQLLKERVTEISSGIATANRCTVSIAFPGNDYPPTVNDAGLWAMVKEISVALVGEAKVHELPVIMGGEDFAFYQERIRGVFVAIGVGNPALGTVHGLHSPKFELNEDALPLGAALHVAVALS